MNKTTIVEVIEMRKIFSLLIFITITILFTIIIYAEPQRKDSNPDEVAIHYIGVEIPLNRIILIRKENQYCALKFNHAWIVMDEERLNVLDKDIKKGGIIAESARESAQKKYATYESYYMNGGTLHFADENIQKKEGTASLLPLRGPFRPFIYQPGNGCVECGQFELLWFYKTTVSFIPLGKSSNMQDYGVELAPTPWTDIKQVNLKDPRIKWYRYDETRKRVFIPIDKLWEEPGKKEETKEKDVNKK